MTDDDLISRRTVRALIPAYVHGDHYVAFDRAIAALPAVSAPDVAVRVKTLEWEEEPDRDPNYPKWTADTGMGKHYFVFKAWWGSQQKWGFAGVDGFYHTKDAAKAAAQADYAARIMAAIDVVDVAELTDPVAVHTNMLRGTIAKPTVEQIVHLYGVDALCKALAPVIVREAEAALPAVSAPADNQKGGGAFAKGGNAVDIRPATSPGVTAGATPDVAELVEALQNIRELNMTAEDENGHKWANSDLIEQEIVAVLAKFKGAT